MPLRHIPVRAVESWQRGGGGLGNSRIRPSQASEDQDGDEIPHGRVLSRFHCWLMGLMPRLIRGRPVEKKPEHRSRTPHLSQTDR
jgi:hypothetical protein